jgi:hypothetical protein
MQYSSIVSFSFRLLEIGIRMRILNFLIDTLQIMRYFLWLILASRWRSACSCTLPLNFCKIFRCSSLYRPIQNHSNLCPYDGSVLKGLSLVPVCVWQICCHLQGKPIKYDERMCVIIPRWQPSAWFASPLLDPRATCVKSMIAAAVAIVDVQCSE